MLLLPLLASSCANLARNDPGALQPQTVSGPCQVKKFFILGTTTVHTAMSLANTGQACTFTIFNPNLQLTLTAALVTSQPSHGRATAGLSLNGRQAAISYAPQTGYAGPDQFTVTLEPHALGMSFSVTVQPSPAAS